MKLFLSIPEQVFLQHDQSQLHHHLLHHLLYSASWSDLFLLWKTPAEAPKGQYELIQIICINQNLKINAKSPVASSSSLE